jgi:hypothetical protein
MGIHRNQKGIYGLKQAGLLANQLLQKRLSPFVYYPDRQNKTHIILPDRG